MRTSTKLSALITMVLMVTLFDSARAQVKVTGVITSEDGMSVPGAAVIEEGTTNGTVTDFDGRYTLSVAGPESVIQISFIGFETQKITVGSQSTIDVVLPLDVQSLDEVVVTGYGGIVKKEDITGAIAQVDTKELERQPLLNATQALQGRAAGVQVAQSSGAPGAGLRVRIRGNTSLTGENNPLVVIDGIIDADLDAINPSDIESMTVLKDASAAAIYGNRAANGVILVTTKKGSSEIPQINFGYWASFSEPTNKYDYLSPYDYARLVNEGRDESAQLSQVQLDSLVESGAGFLQDEVLNDNAFGQNYNLSVSGRSGDVNYLIGGNYYEQEGVVTGSEFERYNGRIKLDGKRNKLSYGTSLNLTHRVGINNNENQGQTNDLLRNLAIFDPLVPRYDSLGRPYSNSETGFGNNIPTNPLFLATQNRRKQTNNTVQGSVNVGYKIFDFLSANLRSTVRNVDRLTLAYTSPSYIAYRDNETGGRSSNRHYNRLNTQFTAGLNFNKTFDKHSINADFIHERRTSKIRDFSASSGNMPLIEDLNQDGSTSLDESILYNDLGSGSRANADAKTENVSSRRLRSSLLRAVYGYESRYNLTASVRYDESNVFPNNQSGVFPALAASWNISNEAFFPVEQINQLSLRAGWGLTGNENIPTDAALDRRNIYLDDTTEELINKMPGVALNPDLKWETTEQVNIGIDLGLFSNALRLSAEWYKKNTNDLLLKTDAPRVTGYNTLNINAGEVENRGFEVSLNATPIETDLVWNLGVVFSKNVNEVISLGDGREFIELGTVDAENVSPLRLTPGQPSGAFYGYIFEGFEVVDNGDGTTSTVIRYKENTDPEAEDDRFYIGDPNPDFTYGITSSLEYKGFDFSVFLQGQKGGDVFNRLRSIRLGEEGSVGPGTHPDILNRWDPVTNPNSVIRPLGATGGQPVSSAYLEDGSYLRLKNVSLGYTLPASVIERWGVSYMKVYVSGQNLLTITDYSGLDPELSSNVQGWDNGQFPLSKTYTVGVNVRF